MNPTIPTELATFCNPETRRYAGRVDRTHGVFITADGLVLGKVIKTRSCLVRARNRVRHDFYVIDRAGGSWHGLLYDPMDTNPWVTLRRMRPWRRNGKRSHRLYQEEQA